MKYLSTTAVNWAITKLREGTHPFLGVTFLACKEADLPVGEATHLQLDSITRSHLDHHHRLAPQSDYYFQPFGKKKTWVAADYPSSGLQAINTQTFSDVFMHPKGSRQWGFVDGYVEKIASVISDLQGYALPNLQAISIWVQKADKWRDDATLETVVAQFLRLYRITDVERSTLFQSPDNGIFDIAPRTIFDADRPDLESTAYQFKYPPDHIVDDRESWLSAVASTNVGPAEEFDMEIGERLTLIAGDNGLGKSFLLDVSWWAITGYWPRHPVFPIKQLGEKNDRHVAPTITYRLRNDRHRELLSGEGTFDWGTHSWNVAGDRPSVSALCVFARADGSFVVSDSMRTRIGAGEQSEFNYFTGSEVWGGKQGQMEGLIRDWINWQLSRDQGAFSKLCEVLARLSPEDLGPLLPGEPTRVPGDPRRIPTVRHPYGNVPILFASAGVQSVLTLAYMMIWMWEEHTLTAQQIGERPFEKMVVIVDEMEAHLHPRWQRTVLPALLGLGDLLSGRLSIQVLVSTHSPIILASMEGCFSDETDVLYHLAIDGSDVGLESLEFHKYGDISAWLTSPVFGLRHARSRRAEKAIEAAKDLQIGDEVEPTKVQKISDELMIVLAPDDPFWPRWITFAERYGVKL